MKFPVLSDVGLKYARELRIVFQVDDSVREPFEIAGIDLKKSNGDDSFELPTPVPLLVDGKGVVRRRFLDLDFTKRLEPEEALEWIDAL